MVKERKKRDMASKRVRTDLERYRLLVSKDKSEFDVRQSVQ